MFVLLSSVACAQADKTASEGEKYYCEPCNGSCDTVAHDKPGICSHCNMKLVKRSADEIAQLKLAVQSRPNVAIFIHDGVELLDFAGPGEVFSSSGFNVYTVAATEQPIISQGFVKITPQYSIANCPKPDIIVLPGGATDVPMRNEDVLRWLKKAIPETTVTLSVCTGAGLLSKTGFLDGKTATTFHNYIDELQRMTPKAKVVRNTRFVDNGSIITTAGVSAGIDGALHVVEKLKGKAAARSSAEYMEYDKWKPEEGLIVKAGQ